MPKASRDTSPRTFDKNLKTTLVLATLLLVQNLALAAPEFITAVGEYQPFTDTSIRVYTENDKIQYKVQSGSTIAGPSQPELDKLSDWFIYPESNQLFWVYSGEGRLLLIEFQKNGTKFTGSEVVKDLLDRAPEEVKKRVSTAKLTKEQ